MQQPASPPPRRSMSPDQPNPAEPITEQPSTLIGRIGWSLRTLLLCKSICYDLFIINHNKFIENTINYH